ncbi:vacuolar cation/proton exchanger 3-like [Magnolia sinica]|uniref:vacuolar cation/proton exchanger 3-like n=1 Tax=Magnolia sinica TaxID=86752 RepID=UPI002657EA29|nr:vacuolar cation/proton exchanger 3-like [Magnolia sinica]
MIFQIGGRRRRTLLQWLPSSSRLVLAQQCGMPTSMVGQFYLVSPVSAAHLDDVVSDEEPAIGFTNAFAWLAGMTAVIALLSEYVVGTIEDTSESWGISVSFISTILLPIIENVVEHASVIVFAFKNKLVSNARFLIPSAYIELKSSFV